MSALDRFLSSTLDALNECLAEPSSADANDKLIVLRYHLELAKDFAAIPQGGTRAAMSALSAFSQSFRGQPIVGTKSLRKAIEDTRTINIASESRFQWGPEEEECLMAALSKVRVADGDKLRLLSHLAELMVREALVRKYPYHALRIRPGDPYTPCNDIKLLNRIIWHLEGARDAVENLSMDWGLPALGGGIHGQIISLLESTTTARDTIMKIPVKSIDGKRKSLKTQKVRIAIRIAASYRQCLRVDPTSTPEGPYHQVFGFCVDGLGLDAGGRWQEYYRPAFAELGITPKRRPSAKPKIDRAHRK